MSNHVHRHFRLFKPYGYLSQFQSNAKHERNKKFLGALYEFPEAVMAIGRLDKDSEGLLLLTTDGKVSFDICSAAVDKEYYAQVDGNITPDAIELLQAGLEIRTKGEVFKCKATKVTKLESVPDFPQRSKSIRDERHGPTSWISIIVNEGKFRQVRKMTSAVGFPTLRLVRVRVGSISLEGLEYGEVEELKQLP